MKEKCWLSVDVKEILVKAYWIMEYINKWKNLMKCLNNIKIINPKVLNLSIVCEKFCSNNCKILKEKIYMKILKIICFISNWKEYEW